MEKPRDFSREHQMQEIVCSHHREGSPYLLPLLDGVSGDQWRPAPALPERPATGERPFEEDR